MRTMSRKVRVVVAASMVAALSLTAGCFGFPDNGDDTVLAPADE